MYGFAAYSIDSGRGVGIEIEFSIVSHQTLIQCRTDGSAQWCTAGAVAGQRVVVLYGVYSAFQIMQRDIKHRVFLGAALGHIHAWRAHVSVHAGSQRNIRSHTSVAGIALVALLTLQIMKLEIKGALLGSTTGHDINARNTDIVIDATGHGRDGGSVLTPWALLATRNRKISGVNRALLRDLYNRVGARVGSCRLTNRQIEVFHEITSLRSRLGSITSARSGVSLRLFRSRSTASGLRSARSCSTGRLRRCTSGLRSVLGALPGLRGAAGSVGFRLFRGSLARLRISLTRSGLRRRACGVSLGLFRVRLARGRIRRGRIGGLGAICSLRSALSCSAGALSGLPGRLCGCRSTIPCGCLMLSSGIGALSRLTGGLCRVPLTLGSGLGAIGGLRSRLCSFTSGLRGIRLGLFRRCRRRLSFLHILFKITDSRIGIDTQHPLLNLDVERSRTDDVLRAIIIIREKRYTHASPAGLRHRPIRNRARERGSLIPAHRLHTHVITEIPIIVRLRIDQKLSMELFGRCDHAAVIRDLRHDHATIQVAGRSDDRRHPIIHEIAIQNDTPVILQLVAHIIVPPLSSLDHDEACRDRGRCTSWRSLPHHPAIA